MLEYTKRLLFRIITYFFFYKTVNINSTIKSITAKHWLPCKSLKFNNKHFILLPKSLLIQTLYAKPFDCVDVTNRLKGASDYWRADGPTTQLTTFHTTVVEFKPRAMLYFRGAIQSSYYNNSHEVISYLQPPAIYAF